MERQNQAPVFPPAHFRMRLLLLLLTFFLLRLIDSRAILPRDVFRIKTKISIYHYGIPDTGQPGSDAPIRPEIVTPELLLGSKPPSRANQNRPVSHILNKSRDHAGKSRCHTGSPPCQR